ncbi:MAG: hypothetical protein NT069_07350 [Planctomycetota bacterium]|nr:hypothetical protein [Planctomycetota bacterium]
MDPVICSIAKLLIVLTTRTGQKPSYGGPLCSIQDLPPSEELS